CGDGVVDAGEACDGGEHCSADCGVVPYCGDGVVGTDEQCDDGNQVDGDGCSAECKEEFCGDGVLQDGEECDDGNDQGGDGCDVRCRIEHGICGCLDLDGDGWQSYYGPCDEPSGVGPEKHLRWLPECLTYNDCDDTDTTVHPYAEEIPGDGIDQNCNSQTSCGVMGEPGRTPWGAGLILVPIAGIVAFRRRLRAECRRR
ncbi:MAG: DUF4215 domain-containing protein, partial [Myxococcales bacterium]|nr:DUF4215 domain-containing protein [Myxococcales bacterium]